MKRGLGLSILFDSFTPSPCTLYHHVESKEEIYVIGIIVYFSQVQVYNIYINNVSNSNVCCLNAVQET